MSNRIADSRFVTPPLLVVVRSPRWTSQIQSWLENLPYTPKAHWLTDVQQARELSRLNHRAAMVFETPEKFGSDPQPFLSQLADLCNNPQQCPLFLLGDSSAEPWKNVFREAGAADICSSMLEFEKFSQRLGRYLENNVRSELSVEQTVIARLPW